MKPHPTTAAVPASDDTLQSEELGTPARSNRRDAERIQTIYRVVRLQHGSDEGLARCRNISDSGIKLETAMEIGVNDPVSVAFSPGCVLSGRVVWTNGRECGIECDKEIDSTRMLSESAAEARSEGARAPRLTVNLPARVKYDGQTRDTLICDMSQYGMKISHDGCFSPGLQVKVSLGNGREKTAVVRWTKGNIAGLYLLEPFAVGELASARNLQDPRQA